MANCTYHLINDFYNQNHEDMALLAEKIEGIEFTFDVESLDVDLDNLEKQLTINNKIRLLEAVGTDIMAEEDQIAAYRALVDEVFNSEDSQGFNGPQVSGGQMEEEDGEW